MNLAVSAQAADRRDCPGLNPAVADQVGQLHDRFDTARPFRHVVIEDFFDKDLLQGLLKEFPPFDTAKAMGDNGQVGGKATTPGVRRLGPAYGRLDDLIRSEAFLRMMSELTGIPDLLYDPYYLGGGTHENLDGQGLEPHIDFNYHPSERWHRRLNLIVYLNPDWDPSWGGVLELFGDPRKGSADQRVVPGMNRCVVFETTENSWHGFDPIHLPEGRKDLSRKSVALYFYSQQRPDTETAAKHTTIYHAKGLPDWCKPGATLDQAGVQQLRALLAHRDGHIDHLYGENARLLQAQEKGLTGQLLYLLKRVYVRARR